MKRGEKVALAGVLSAFAVASGALESLIPPLPFAPPGFRIGISNVASMTAAAAVSPLAAFAVAIIKSVFVLITRGFTAFLLSLAGGLVSACVTVLLLRFARGKVGCIGIGVASAAFHNLAQVCVYSLIIGAAAFWYLPYLLILGTACGALTGILLDLALRFISKRDHAPDGAEHKH
ncbi:MAG: Gx transporter family protein [Clostridia bacterium]|nr:Gx transporter family protein [Clostridia bacterium]